MCVRGSRTNLKEFLPEEMQNAGEKMRRVTQIGNISSSLCNQSSSCGTPGALF